MKHIRNLAGMLVLPGLLLMLVFFVFGVRELMQQPFGSGELAIVPYGSMQWEEWSSNLQIWAVVAIVISMLLALFWYVWGQWFLRVERTRQANKRVAWAVITTAAAATCLLCCHAVWTQTESGTYWVVGFFFLFFLGAYWLPSALFSPSSFKYTPIGASHLRRW